MIDTGVGLGRASYASLGCGSGCGRPASPARAAAAEELAARISSGLRPLMEPEQVSACFGFSVGRRCRMAGSEPANDSGRWSRSEVAGSTSSSRGSDPDSPPRKRRGNNADATAVCAVHRRRAAPGSSPRRGSSRARWPAGASRPGRSSAAEGAGARDRRRRTRGDRAGARCRAERCAWARRPEVNDPDGWVAGI